MVDFKTVINQVQELKIILLKINVEGMIFRETFQVATIIEKLPHAWKGWCYLPCVPQDDVLHL